MLTSAVSLPSLWSSLEWFGL